jgi:hypothetical protein
MRLQALGIVAVVFTGMVAYEYYDKNVNFQPVAARISAVNDQCYMEKVEHLVVVKTTSTSDVVRCDVAELLTHTHTKWRGYDVKHKIEVQIAYVSPVDGAAHTSSLYMSAFPGGQPLHVGDQLQVLASKTKADKTREI